MPPTLETDLEALFSSRADVAFALLFGSAASGRRTAESDVDLADDFVRVKQRSRSLSEIDRSRLVRIVDFLDDELADAPDFERPDLERYSTDRTYRETLEQLGTVDGFRPPSVDTAHLARNTRVPNMLAHEYLDLRYSRVHDVADDAASVYGALVA
ncbi:MAG: nucleotidyltransferase domain-containing protein, partial [Spirochaetota bacterium]